MRLLVCGDRNWTDLQYLIRELDDFHKRYNVTTVIHGDARGADKLAGAWALTRKIHVQAFPANWDAFGKAAGVLRNQQMLDEGRPEYVLAFHDSISTSRGTADMVRRAKRASLPVTVVSHRSQAVQHG